MTNLIVNDESWNGVPTDFVEAPYHWLYDLENKTVEVGYWHQVHDMAEAGYWEIFGAEGVVLPSSIASNYKYIRACVLPVADVAG